MADEPWNVRTLVFDVLGTVVDETGCMAGEVSRALAAAGADPAQGAPLAEQWKRRIDERHVLINSGAFGWQAQDDLSQAAIDEVIAGSGASLDRAVLDRLATVGHRLPPWPDSPASLRALSERFLTVALSDANMSALADLARRGGLRWHCVLSGELVQAYKPDPAVYRLALSLLRLTAARTMMVAAHPWDLRAAAAHGMRTAYVRRPGGQAPDPTDRFDIEVDSLADLANRLPSAA